MDTRHAVVEPRGWLPHVPAARDLATVGAAALAAALAGYELANGNKPAAVAFCLLPLVALLLARPTVPLVLLGASIPALQSLPGVPGGYNVAISDLLLVLVSAGILLHWATTGSAPELRALRPVALPLLGYGTAMVLLLGYHFGLGEVAQTVQRFELFLAPLVVGAFAVLKGRHVAMLQAYVLSTTALALVWPLHSFGLQKNPAGQLVGNAILLLFAVPALRRYLPCLVALVPGLLLTQSRGAIIATVIGVVVVMLLQGLTPRSFARRALPLVLIAGVAFALLPSAARDRITTLRAGTDSRAAYAIQYRQQYSQDAWQIIDAHPWTGIGVGNYLAGDPSDLTQVSDPHQVLLLQAAEGGYGFAGAFVVLVLGAFAALRRMRHVELAPAAAGVLMATAAHGLVDVYWVRGTPVLGWLLVGMACAGLALQRDAEPET